MFKFPAIRAEEPDAFLRSVRPGQESAPAEPTGDMFFILIPIVWLALLAVIVAGCRLAARGDAHVAGERGSSTTPGPPAEEPLITVPGLTVWDCAQPDQLRSLAASLSAPRPGLPGPAARRPNGRAVRASRARAVRRHGARSTARS